MRWGYLLWTCLLVTATRSTPDTQKHTRTLSRLIGGHLRIDPDADFQDTELATADAGGGNSKPDRQHPEEKKTLSQQVADGKYGLIQKELFSKPARRPGILSYKSNPDVPSDNANTLGKLDKNEIWLAENHLLVLKGGGFPEHGATADDGPPVWPPIDDYTAPLRPVKIPAHPKVPPPFPVQLSEDGPVRILGANASRPLGGAYAVPPPEGYVPGTGPYFPGADPADAPPGDAAHPVTPHPDAVQGEYRPGDGRPPFPSSNGTWPPSFASLPPGAVIIPGPDNLTELYDDDDPSIYYPPPYSFYYPRDNRTAVKAGPLVPGIILPPPPDFFGPLEEDNVTTTTVATTKKPSTKSPQRTVTVTTKKTVTVVVTPVNRVKPHKIATARKKPQTITVLQPLKTSTVASPVYDKQNEARAKPFEKYGPPVTTTTTAPPNLYASVPKLKLKNSQVDINFVSKTTAPSPPHYYYYEKPRERSKTTQRPPSNYYSNELLPPRDDKIKIYYLPNTAYVMEPPKYQPSDSFSIHIAKLQKQIQTYATARPKENRQQPPKPIYQYNFEAADYNRHPQSQHKLQNEYRFNQRPKYSVQIQEAIEIIPSQLNAQSTTAAPPVYYQSEGVYNPRQLYTATPRPHYQTTQSPVYQNVYTKPEDNYFDDITKQYFTMFGKKIVSSTTPIPSPQVSNTVRPHFDASLVPRQYVNTRTPSEGAKWPSGLNPEGDFAGQQQFVSKPISLHGDTNVNYNKWRPPINPNAEFIKEGVAQRPYDPQRGSYIQYQLPGDNAHFYFLTPQLVGRTDQGVGYYYAKANTTSVLDKEGI